MSRFMKNLIKAYTMLLGVMVLVVVLTYGLCIYPVITLSIVVGGIILGFPVLMAFGITEIEETNNELSIISKQPGKVSIRKKTKRAVRGI